MKSIFDRIKDKAYTKSMIEYAKQENTKVFAWGTGIVGTGKWIQMFKRVWYKSGFFL